MFRQNFIFSELYEKLFFKIKIQSKIDRFEKIEKFTFFALQKKSRAKKFFFLLYLKKGLTKIDF